MYNLFISGNCDAWRGSPERFQLPRCLREYTDDRLKQQYADLSEENIAILQSYPCIFAHEKSCDKSARFGHLTRVARRENWVRIEYAIDTDSPEIPPGDLVRLGMDLDIDNSEMTRTHWALKDVDLHAVLSQAGVADISRSNSSQLIDITKVTFDVALSFPGETRHYAQAVADKLSLLLGRSRVFFRGLL